MRLPSTSATIWTETGASPYSQMLPAVKGPDFRDTRFLALITQLPVEPHVIG